MEIPSSSSGVGKISKGPQVFINFRGHELRKDFMAYLELALRQANINVFIDEQEMLGTNLQNLLVRIEQSRVALAIFSKEYTTSEWCLDELVKIKECMDKGSLIGIPIFYKLKTSVVSNLEGHFGDNFRKLKRHNQHDLVRTQKWEEALTSIPQTKGMYLSEERLEKWKFSNDRPMMKKLRNSFVAFLEPMLRDANINVFIDKDEVAGTDLTNLLVRIEESRVAVVIFSKDYTSSEWCLDELATIKECKDQGSLSVIPIFYKLEPSMVRERRGDFGDTFRSLKRTYLHEPERTLKWEEALESIPKIKGLSLSEKGDRNEREFIESMVLEIQRLLSQIAVRSNPKIESNPQGGFLVPARRLDITHSDNPEKWAWSSIYDRP